MSGAWRAAPAPVLAFALGVACGGAPLRSGALDDMDRVRASAGAQEGARLAPEVHARAEQERELARQAHRAGDDVGAMLHADRAVVAYGHALAVGRLARATADLAEAQKALDDATLQEQALDASRIRLEHDADLIQDRVRLARERIFPASSAPATAEREAARLVAARSLAMQARLLCGAARLVAPEAAGLADAAGELGTLDERLAKNARPVPIDDAAHTRAHCLDLLTRARRTLGDDPAANDALLSELSAAGGWDPARDERGVAITLHDPFQGSELARGASTRLNELGRVASSHPGFAIQVVVHDALAPGLASSARADETDARRAEAAVRALVGGGAVASRIHAELAGGRAPVVDPADGKDRARNERLEIVFVGTGH